MWLQSDHDFLFYVNNDVLVPDGAVDIMAQAMSPEGKLHGAAAYLAVLCAQLSRVPKLALSAGPGMYACHMSHFIRSCRWPPCMTTACLIMLDVPLCDSCVRLIGRRRL